MKKVLMLLVFVLLNLPLLLGQKTKNQMKVIYYENALKDTSCSDTNRILFFKSFPSSFKELNDVYGWDDKNKTGKELYGVAEQHLGLFKKMYQCYPKQWTLKSIKIALNGKWDADAVNYFQDLLQEQILKNPNLYFSYLAKFTEKENISFWKFIVDGTFRHEPTILKFKKITEKNSVQSKYFKAAVRLKWKN